MSDASENGSKIKLGGLVSGHFEKTGQMKISRFGPGVALLKDGRVLVFGGQVDTNAADFKLGEIRPSQAEIYDPVTGEYSLTGDLQVARTQYATTLLQDGRVAIIGGYFGVKPVSDIELYDAKTGRFSVVAHLKIPRTGPAVTTLKDGRVLIVGGNMDERTAELYDPKTGAVSLLPSLMSEGRRVPYSILLDDGRVFIARGHDHSPGIDIFDPKSETFSEAAPFLDKRLSVMFAKLANGEILMAGGVIDQAQVKDHGVNRVYSAQIYNPIKNEWRYTKGSIQTPKVEGSCILLNNGKVLIAGDGDRFPYEDPQWTPMQIFDPKTEAFESIGYLHFRYATPKLVKLNSGKVLIVGKTTDKKDSYNSELYVPKE